MYTILTHNGKRKQERNYKYEALCNGEIIYSDYVPDVFQFIRYFARDISNKKGGFLSFLKLNA